MEFEVIDIEKAEGEQVILGHAGFIKTVEDLYEAMVGSVPSATFGIAFAEASGPCLIRFDGNDEELKNKAVYNMQKIRCGHTFIIIFKNAYPINVLNSIKQVQEVARIYCATANPVQVVVCVTNQGRGVVGVIDGYASKGVESEDDKKSRHKLLRDIGYKR
ncbi:MAG: adenosine-specific kinase [Candidatus Micrarchaeaceae archaeon]